MKPVKRVALYTLGCKLNFSETSTISRAFTDAGYDKVDFDDCADVYVINTCSVTEIADKKCRNAIHKAVKRNPDAKVVIVGCYAQLKPEQLITIQGVDLVLSNKDKHRIIEFLDNNYVGTSSCDFKELNDFNSAWSIDDRTRSFLKIQDGCDYFCSYCTIPKARGLSRSDTMKNVIEKAQSIVDKGIKEIILTGVNIGDFGRKNDESFYDLLRAFHAVQGLERLRLSSVESNLLEDRIIDLVANSKLIMPHFHVPLQCGVDKLLSSMRRRYTTQEFKNKIDTIRKKIPDAYIAIDIIVGVPSETEEDFQETISFIETLELSELHIFTYSERPDTDAIKMPQVQKHIRKWRSQQLHERAKQYNAYFCKRFESQTRLVLFEKGTDKRSMEGFTDNYLKVSVPFDARFVNEIKRVRLHNFDTENQFFTGTIEE
jgi:threonylcarbamoyladenosine tRNA methylthiotransferase MtaB